MKQIRILIMMLVAFVASSSLKAQNDLVLRFAFDNENDYNWYVYNMVRPQNQQLYILKITEHKDQDKLFTKDEYIIDYNLDTTLNTIGKISYSSAGFPIVSADSFFYPNEEDKDKTRLLGRFKGSYLQRYFYDNSGRIIKVVSIYGGSESEQIEGETLVVDYADNTSDIIRSIAYIDPEDEEENWKADFKYKGNTLTVTLKGSDSTEVDEFQKVNNRWLRKKVITEGCTDTYNEEGLIISSKYKNESLEITYVYNNNGDLVKTVRKDDKGIRVTREYEYEYDSRMNWIKRWAVKDGQRRLIAEREYMYRVQ